MLFTCITKKKLTLTAIIVASLILTVFSLSGFGYYQVFYGSNMRKLPIYSVNRDDKKISISFDCAWGVDYTDKLLEIMQGENVKCTFFAVEFWTVKYPEYIKKINESGHEIGTHSSTHPYMSKLDKSAIIKELNNSKQAIENITGKTVQVFRPPYGDYDDLLIETSLELGLYPIQWSVDSLDWKNLSAREIKERVLKNVKSGSIVLFHNQGLHTAEALPDIIKCLKNDGYEFVPIGELIYKDNYTVSPNGEQRLNS